MQDFLLTMLQTVIIIATPIVAAFAIRYFNALIGKAKAATKSETAKRILSEVENATATAVLSTAQAYVDELKKNGTFSIENQKEAARIALEQAAALLSSDIVEYIKNEYGDVMEYLKPNIEVAVRWDKESSEVTNG